MGQYYKVLIKGKKVKKAYDIPYGCKLMEHSWCDNKFCLSVVAELIDNPKNIAWVGDYAERQDYEKFKLGTEPKELWWSKSLDKPVAFKPIKSLNEVKFLVNKTKKQFIDLAEYQRNSINKNYDTAPFPLSLLTAIGNGQGGGDYFSPVNLDLIGTWAFDKVYFTNDLPQDYKKIDVWFDCD
ncbi:hypothetical protein OFO01_07225 [Campylobacter sp. JMF_01 NE2]|uniref:hypothetical protein n=1 Tax=unclassified Campylobacter TaxID=2593542 RepID=UPI0022E99BB3|nr:MULTISPECIES: hypothetical protein [unclassified Campylobacter]MDA3053245.1 hypothetical protein [Campylobacter sp. JMF_03 NE3]MDA3067572.1 hypothetical protein [Campylobacter sp. JMF_01 NE2]